MLQGRKVSVSVSRQSKRSEGIRLSSRCMFLTCDLLTFSHCLNGQRLSFAEAQPVPVSLPLLFRVHTEIPLVPHLWQDDRVDSSVACG